MEYVPFDELHDCDLRVGATYAAGNGPKHFANEPIRLLLPVGVAGGIRFKGSIEKAQLATLKSTGSHPDWPDVIDLAQHRLTYFGDNNKPGSDIHAPRGNRLLRSAFLNAYNAAGSRADVPPFFVFTLGKPPNEGVTFAGVAVPGTPSGTLESDLVAIWQLRDGEPFQNYRAEFTFLECPIVPRVWINELAAGLKTGPASPAAYREWVTTGDLGLPSAQPNC